MSAADIAADQLKCVRALSVILADGALTLPKSWTIHTFPGYEPSLTPMLEGFFHEFKAPTLAELHAVLDVYGERYGLKVEEKPHGEGGRIAVHATGVWQGVEVHVWGPAVSEAGVR